MLDITTLSAEKRTKIIAQEAELFLNNTDYYQLRELRGGEPMPANVKSKRDKCVALVVKPIQARLENEFFNIDNIEDALLNLAVIKSEMLDATLADIIEE